MKNIKLGFGLSTLAIAAVMALTTSQNATANILRETSDPNSAFVDASVCPTPAPVYCAYEFTDDNQPIGEYDAIKL